MWWSQKVKKICPESTSVKSFNFMSKKVLAWTNDGHVNGHFNSWVVGEIKCPTGAGCSKLPLGLTDFNGSVY